MMRIGYANRFCSATCFLAAVVGISPSGAQGTATAEKRPSPAEYRIIVNGKQTGMAELQQKLLPNGNKSVELTMTIREGENRVVIKTETTYLPDGEVKQSDQAIYPFGKPAVKHVLAEMSGAGAKVTTTGPTGSSITNVPRKQSWPVSNPSTFWFLNVTPSVGAVTKTYVFNMDLLKWERCVVTYEGTTHRGHLVRLEKSGRTVETAFDDGGFPVSIEDSGGVQLERT